MTRNSSRKRSADDAEESTVTLKKTKAASGKPHKRVAPPAPTNGGSASGSAHDSESAQPVPEASGSTGSAVSVEGDASGAIIQSGKKKGKQRASGEEEAPNDSPAVTYRKLKPPRPFPTVPTSVSATGPRSAHLDGKNYLCITRKTPLGMYLRRCKDVVLKDGHKTLHLSAMGAAIPHLLQLTLSLPEILPYPEDEIKTEVLTGSVEVQDEVIPDDEDEDISIRTRGKSTLSVVITIGDGIDQGPANGKGRPKAAKSREMGGGRAKASGGGKGKKKDVDGAQQQQQQGSGSSGVEQVVFREEELNE